VSPPAPRQPRKLSAPVAGDAVNGQKLVADRTRGGSCLACHVVGPAGGTDLPGNVGPDLSEIGNAGREDEWLFNYIYDARVYNAETAMPPWGHSRRFKREGDRRRHGVPQDAESASRWTGGLIAAELDDVHEQQVWRFLRSQKIDMSK
jgi:hypothetical protein